MCIFPTNGLLSWSARERSSIRPDHVCVCMNAVFSCVDLYGQPCVYMHVCMCEYGNTSSALSLAGPGDVELQQPCLHWAARFSSP